jgi:hypothetical protein
LERATSGQRFDEIYCLAWEGGHHDHDASHAIGVAYAKRHGLLDRCFELPLYRKALGPFFRVLAPLPGEAWQTRRLTRREGFRLSVLPFRFRSQVKSWLGLYPGAFFRLVVLRQETLRRVDPARLFAPPHRGSLFYERRFRFERARFMQAAEPFLKKHFG